MTPAARRVVRFPVVAHVGAGSVPVAYRQLRTGASLAQAVPAAAAQDSVATLTNVASSLGLVAGAGFSARRPGSSGRGLPLATW